MGARRGARHDCASDPVRWWAWGSAHYQRLAEWLDHVAGAGYVELVVVSKGVPLSFELRAYRQDRTAGYAVLLVDGGEELWLEDHWPRALVEEREDDHVRGRLHAAVPARGSS
jgi:hypothetical protein